MEEKYFLLHLKIEDFMDHPVEGWEIRKGDVRSISDLLLFEKDSDVEGFGDVTIQSYWDTNDYIEATAAECIDAVDLTEITEDEYNTLYKLLGEEWGIHKPSELFLDLCADVAASEGWVDAPVQDLTREIVDHLAEKKAQMLDDLAEKWLNMYGKNNDADSDSESDSEPNED